MNRAGAVRLRELAASRSSNAETQEEVFNLLERWYVLGKPPAAGRGARRDETEPEGDE